MTPAPGMRADTPHPDRFDAVPASPFVRRMPALTLAALLALVALGLAWELWLAPTGRGTLALKVLPLVLCVPGVLRHRMFTYRWLALLVWLYALEGLVRVTSASRAEAALAGVEIALAVVLFAVCSSTIRHRLKHPLPAPSSP